MKYSICLLQAVAFLDLLAVGMIVPQVPSHVRKMGANHIYVGLLGSIYAGCQLGSGPVIGSLSDIKGRKSILLLTLLMCAISYTSMGFTSSVLVILTIRAALGVFKQTQVLTKALVPDYEKSENLHSSIYGQMAAISGAGVTIGPVIGGHIAEDYPENGFVYIATIVGICFVLNSGFVYLLPKPVKDVSKKNEKKKNIEKENVFKVVYSSLKQSVIELYKINWLEYWDVFIFKGLVGFAMGVYYSNYALYLKTQYELSPKYIGYVISFQGVIGSVSSFYSGFVNSFYKKDADYSLRNLHIFVLLSTALLGLVWSYNIFTYVIWLIPLAVGNAIGRLVTLEMILKRSHGTHRGTLIGASNSVRSLSGVVAPMIAGFIAEYFGVVYVVYASLLSTSIGVIMSYYTRSKLIKDKSK